MRKLFAGIVTAVVLFGSTVSAQEPSAAPANLEKTPWLKGVEISPYPVDISPVIPMKIYADNGEQIPAVLTEDVPITVMADTAIFDPAPPSSYKGQEIPNPRWEDNPAVSWFFIDWEQNKNFPAESEGLAANQMVIIPTTPTGKAAITCHIGRRMRYDLPEPGKTKVTFANSSVARDVRVLDITPPTCGLEITVKKGGSGAFWPVENPPNQYPLPKKADVYLNGALFGAVDQDIMVPGIELGANMIIAPEHAVLTVAADDELTVKVIGSDNHKLDEAKIKYGISSGAGGEPAPIGPENAPVIELSKLKVPENAYLFLDASDISGNRQVIYVPLKVK